MQSTNASQVSEQSEPLCDHSYDPNLIESWLALNVQQFA